MRWVVPALCLVSFTVYGVGTLSASVPRWLAIYAVFILGSVWLCAHVVRGGKVKPDALDIAVWLFVLLSAESLIWAGDWRAGVYHLANMAAIAGLFCLVRRLPAENFRTAVFLAVPIALVSLSIWPGDHGGFGNRNFAAEFMLISIPIVLGAKCELLRKGWSLLWRRRSISLVSISPASNTWWWRGWSVRRSTNVRYVRSGWEY